MSLTCPFAPDLRGCLSRVSTAGTVVRAADPWVAHRTTKRPRPPTGWWTNGGEAAPKRLRLQAVPAMVCSMTWWEWALVLWLPVGAVVLTLVAAIVHEADEREPADRAVESLADRG